MPSKDECNDQYTIISDASCIPFPTPSQDFFTQVETCRTRVLSEYNSQINGNNTTQLECKEVVSYTDYSNVITGNCLVGENCTIDGNCSGNVATYSNICTTITSNISEITDLNAIPNYNDLMITCLANVEVDQCTSDLLFSRRTTRK